LAIANAKLAYEKFKEVCASERATKLKEDGAWMQRPLWASTSTKNPAYPDTLYIDELIGPSTVNTVPPNTLEAFKDHGTVRQTLESGMPKASQAFEELRTVGILFQQVAKELEEEGVKAFADSFTALLEAIENRRKTV
jgi:transaldolase